MVCGSSPRDLLDAAPYCPTFASCRRHLELKPLEVAEFFCDRTGVARGVSFVQPIRPLTDPSIIQSALLDAISLRDFKLGYLRSSRRMLDVASESSSPLVVLMAQVLPLTAETGLSSGRALQVKGAPLRALLQGGDSNILLEPEALVHIQSIEQRLRELPDVDRFARSLTVIALCFQYGRNKMSGLKIDSTCDLARPKSKERISSDVAFDPNASRTRIDFEYPSGKLGLSVITVDRPLEKSNEVIAVAFDGGRPSFKQNAIMAAVMDNVLLILHSIAAIFVVLLRLPAAVAALMIVLLASSVSRATCLIVTHPRSSLRFLSLLVLTHRVCLNSLPSHRWASPSTTCHLASSTSQFYAFSTCTCSCTCCLALVPMAYSFS